MRSIYILGEQVVVIGDNALWEIRESQITKTKVLEDDISCGTVLPKTNDFNIIIANFSHQIFIYTSSYLLLWAMKAN
jgi:hypothetical protein